MPTKRIRTYPEKNCPTCGVLFAKQGKFCSRECGNVRTFTATQRAKQSNVMQQKMIDDPEYKQARVATIQPDIPIPPQKESPIGLNQFISDGDLWTEAE
jgi:predicted nucleic acid-binding Zn ribbon protein